ncbi:MAG: Fe-S cluster assembly protein SufD [Anaerolineaceae bacterium]|jgi:Fe-S cluster assembly protein SufD|nr:MAG: Fe-S cluster assembly protein SufD [Anaerolineaceae bacterium]
MSNAIVEPEKTIVEMAEFPFVDAYRTEIDSCSYLNDLRSRSLDYYRSQPFPDKTAPAWRKVSLQGFQPQDYHLPGESTLPPEQPALDLPAKYLKDMHCIQRTRTQEGSRLFVPQISEKGISCVLVSDSSPVLPKKVIEKIGQIIPPSSDKFTAFGYAFARETAVIYVSENTHVDAPIFYQETFQGERLAVPSTTMIYLACNSSATILRQQNNPAQSKAFSAGVTEIFLEEGAKLDLIDLQTTSSRTWDIQNQKAVLEKDAGINWFTLLLSAEFSKAQLEVDLVGQGSQALITGLFLPAGTQRFYMDTVQNHLARNTTSDLLYRGVVDGESQSRWQGMIYVDKQAVRTDGYQANHNLILSKTAKIDSIPGLEILTDDVRCSHGVTITNIDADQLFYLKSRGIQDQTGTTLIVSGFIQKALDRIKSDAIQQLVLEEFISRINKNML